MANEAHEASKLQHMLDEALKLWNEAKYDDLAKVFDEDIIIKKLDDPGSVSGIGNVLVYLDKSQKPKKPQFKIKHAEPAYIWADGTVAQISGTAEYQDKIQDPKIVPVRFTFTFNRDDEGDGWLVVNAFQARRRD